MPSMTDDFYMPIMYQDLRNPSAGMYPTPFGMGMYPTNYLGGIRLPRELQNDKFVFQDRAKREKKSFKTVALILGGLVSVALLKNKGAFKWLSTNLKKGADWVKDLFKTTPKPTTPPPSTP